VDLSNESAEANQEDEEHDTNRQLFVPLSPISPITEGEEGRRDVEHTPLPPSSSSSISPNDQNSSSNRLQIFLAAGLVKKAKKCMLSGDVIGYNEVVSTEMLSILCLSPIVTYSKKHKTKKNEGLYLCFCLCPCLCLCLCLCHCLCLWRCCCRCLCLCLCRCRVCFRCLYLYVPAYMSVSICRRTCNIMTLCSPSVLEREIFVALYKFRSMSNNARIHVNTYTYFKHKSRTQHVHSPITAPFPHKKSL